MKQSVLDLVVALADLGITNISGVYAFFITLEKRIDETHGITITIDKEYANTNSVIIDWGDHITRNQNLTNTQVLQLVKLYINHNAL